MDGKHRFRKLALRLVFFALLGWAVALVRAVLPRRGWYEWSEDESAWTPKLFEGTPAVRKRDGGG